MRIGLTGGASTPEKIAPTEVIREATAGDSDPMGALRTAVRVLYDSCVADLPARRPLVIDLVQALHRTHHARVWAARGPLLTVFTELLSAAQRAGLLRPGAPPDITAAIIVQTVMYLAESIMIGQAPERGQPLAADEVWQFCAYGFTSAQG
jgi:hypothetical protein